MIDFKLLGRIELSGSLEGAADPSGLLSQPKPTALLVYLLLDRPEALQRRDALAALLWPESDQRRARGALSQTLYVIRRHLGAGVLVARGTEEVGVAPGTIRCDVLEFQHLLEVGRRADALALYGGELLPSFYLPETAGFEHWLDGERAALRRAAERAAWELAEEFEAQGDAAAATQWARWAARNARHDEAALRRLMEVLARHGDRAGALAEYDRYAKRLRDEMELETESETSALAARIGAEGKRGEGPPVPARPRADAFAGAGVAGPEAKARSLARRAAGPALAFAVIIAGFALLSRVLFPPAPEVARGEVVPSLAVLPIRGEARQSEQITRRLIETFEEAGLRTQGWLSVSRFTDTTTAAEEIGRRLGVEYLLEGTVGRSDDRIRFSVSLVDAADGVVVWSDSFDGPARRVRDLEVEIARSAVERVATRSGRDPSAFRIRRYTQDATADSLYRWGVYLSNHSYNPIALRRVAEAFEGAIRIDSTFALAYVGLAATLFQQSRVFWDPPPREQMPRVLELLFRAQQLAPELSQTYSLLGWYYYGFARDYPRALASHREAIRLAPTQARAYLAYAFPLLATGSADSGLVVAALARELEPLNPLVVSTQCWIQYLADRLEDALGTCSFVTDSLDATFKVALDIQQLVSHLLMARNGDAEGLVASRRAMEANPPPPVAERELYFERGPAWWWALLGDTARAFAALEEEKAQPRVRPLRIANDYAAVGEMDSAYAWLDRAIEARDPYVPEIAVRPGMESLRRDPRFAEYRRRLGLDFRGGKAGTQR